MLKRLLKVGKKSINRNEVETTNSKEALTSDKNNDGIPDYLQGPEIQSVVAANKDLNQWEADVEKEIEEWIMGLRGYEFSVEKNAYVPVSPPIMNEIGIKKLKTHLAAIVNKHSINTGLKENEVHEICKRHSKTLVEWFTFNYKNCGVGLSDLTPICSQFDYFSYIVLSRAINDGQRSHVTKRTSLTGQVGSGQQPTI